MTGNKARDRQVELARHGYRPPLWSPGGPGEKLEKLHGSRACYRKCTDGPDGGRCRECKNQEAAYTRAYRAIKRLEANR